MRNRKTWVKTKMKWLGKFKIINLLVLTIVASTLITIFLNRLLLKSNEDTHSISLLTVDSTHIHIVNESTSVEPTVHQDCKSWKRLSEHKTTLITKNACEWKYFLLILVSSAPSNFERRMLIRQTWGPDRRDIPQWKTYFLLGQTRNQTLSDSLIAENATYNDIIRGDYYEHYWNQSFKIQMAFEWAVRYCNFSYLLKGDDDVLVNTRNLIDVLQLESTPKTGLYMGKLHSNPIVLRDGKWRVSYEEYSGDHYPDFCSGAGFVMSHDVVECIVPLFDVIKPFRLDDVYVGMLAKKSRVTAGDHTGFVMPWWDYDNCNFVPHTLVQHRATGECLIKLFNMHLLA